MEQFLNEALKTGKGIKLGDALKVGGMVTGVGLGIVFAVLIILMLVLMLFKVIFYKKPAEQQTAPNQAAEPVYSEPKKTAETGMSENELIAVLTAAVAASLNTSTYNLRIKSYRRVETKQPVWNRAGINETIDSRF